MKIDLETSLALLMSRANERRAAEANAAPQAQTAKQPSSSASEPMADAARAGGANEARGRVWNSFASSSSTPAAHATITDAQRQALYADASRDADRPTGDRPEQAQAKAPTGAPPSATTPASSSAVAPTSASQPGAGDGPDGGAGRRSSRRREKAPASASAAETSSPPTKSTRTRASRGQTAEASTSPESSRAPKTSGSKRSKAPRGDGARRGDSGGAITNDRAAKRLGRAALRGARQADEARAPSAPTQAGASLRDAVDRRGTAQALADRAGVGRLSGVPMGPQSLELRARTISDALLQGREPPAFKGRAVEVTAAERASLQSGNPTTRRRVADDVGRREADRDSLVQAAGSPERAAAMEKTWSSMTQAERDQVAPQRDRETAANNVARVGHEVFHALPVGRMVRTGLAGTALLKQLQSPAVDNARRAYNAVNDALGAPLPHLPSVGVRR